MSCDSPDIRLRYIPNSASINPAFERVSGEPEGRKMKKCLPELQREARSCD